MALEWSGVCCAVAGIGIYWHTYIWHGMAWHVLCCVLCAWPWHGIGPTIIFLCERNRNMKWNLLTLIVATTTNTIVLVIILVSIYSNIAQVARVRTNKRSYKKYYIINSFQGSCYPTINVSIHSLYILCY